MMDFDDFGSCQRQRWESPNLRKHLRLQWKKDRTHL